MATLVNIRLKFFRTIMGKKMNIFSTGLNIASPTSEDPNQKGAIEPFTGSSENNFMQRNINLHKNPLHFFAMISLYGMWHCPLTLQWQIGKSFCIFVARAEIMSIYNKLGLQGINCHLVKPYPNAFRFFFNYFLLKIISLK